MPLADPLAVLEALYTEGDPTTSTPSLLVRVSSLPPTRPQGRGWRLELSQDGGDTWTSLEAGQPGHATPSLAIEEGQKRVAAWKEARVEAHDHEISLAFRSGKLQRKKILIDANDGLGERKIEVDGYAALADDDKTWIESPNPIDAIARANEHGKVKARDVLAFHSRAKAQK